METKLKKSKGVIVDIGSGDGKFVYELAKENPEKFVIGIDPSTKPLEKISVKIYKKPKRGGLPNVLFIQAAVENLPEELSGVANQVFINFPWGSLLAGIVKADKNIWRNIKRICKKGAFIDIIFGYDQSRDKSEIERLQLPIIGRNLIHQILPQKLSELGLKVIKTQKLNNEILKLYPSSWGKKLVYGGRRIYYYMRVVIP